MIKVYDRPNALFYCDPPYNTKEKIYNNPFTQNDHERLNRSLSNIKGRFILSYNDDEYIRELYKDYNITAVERQNNLSSGTYKELIITNY
ncbi:Site-specific DNA methylase [uncultured Ruminococcus sp.]|nr:Site-specific DNA methylase [uncultured Ruminococcus sp.]